MLVVTKRDRKMLARLEARAAILRERLTGPSTAAHPDIISELHSLEWAIAKLTGAST